MVQSSFDVLGPRISDLATTFYQGLFADCPSARGMFTAERATQEQLFVTELGTIVNSISQFDSFVDRTRGLGARHAGFGVTHLHYQIAGQALMDALVAVLGAEFTDELSDAWRLAFDLVAETMMQGAADASA
jgi:hemoglobin-like flavoprotein